MNKPTHCDGCGVALPVFAEGYCGGSGYSVRCSDGAVHCYPCSDLNELAHMVEDGQACLYLVKRDGRNVLTTWPGTISFNPIYGSVNHSDGYGFGRRYPVVTGRFVGPDGYVWSFRNAGDMQLARCKRTKKRSLATPSIISNEVNQS